MGCRKGGIPTDLTHSGSLNENTNQTTYINPVTRCNQGLLKKSERLQRN